MWGPWRSRGTCRRAASAPSRSGRAGSPSGCSTCPCWCGPTRNLRARQRYITTRKLLHYTLCNTQSLWSWSGSSDAKSIETVTDPQTLFFYVNYTYIIFFYIDEKEKKLNNIPVSMPADLFVPVLTKTFFFNLIKRYRYICSGTVPVLSIIEIRRQDIGLVGSLIPDGVSL